MTASPSVGSAQYPPAPLVLPREGESCPSSADEGRATGGVERRSGDAETPAHRLSPQSSRGSALKLHLAPQTLYMAEIWAVHSDALPVCLDSIFGHRQHT